MLALQKIIEDNKVKMTELNKSYADLPIDELATQLRKLEIQRETALQKYKKAEAINKGRENEDKLIGEIEKAVGVELQHTKCATDHFDFESADGSVLVELKCRTNSSGRYPTTLIGACKFKDQNRLKDKQVYVFINFTDGLYYIRYDAELFKKYDTKFVSRRDRYRIEKGANHILIPISHMTKA